LPAPAHNRDDSPSPGEEVLAALALALRPVLAELLTSAREPSPVDDDGRWLTAGEAARYAGVSRRTIYRALSAGTLRGGRVTTPRGCNRWRLRTADIDAWIDAGANTTADVPPATARLDTGAGGRPTPPRAPTSSYRRRARRTKPRRTKEQSG